MQRILVADDEKSVRMVLSSLLREQGYEVLEAVNGEQAVEMALREKPQVICLDLRMPVMDGLEALAKLKQEELTREIPVLVLTAAGEKKSQATKAGADDFLQKPFDADEVALRVNSMLKISGLTDELRRVVAYLGLLEKGKNEA